MAGESLVHAPETDYNKIGSYAQPATGLSVSVSFGRFESDSLSWERWSTFSSNKYLEEAEKFSTRGSVAQKKAYFEAHYKKIGSKKDELSDQEDEDKASPSEVLHENSVDLVMGVHDEDNAVENHEAVGTFQESSVENPQVSLSEEEVKEFEERMFSQGPNEQGVFNFEDADGSHDFDIPHKLKNDLRIADHDIDSVVQSSGNLEDDIMNYDELKKAVVKKKGKSFEHPKISEDVEVGSLRTSAKSSHKPRTRSEMKSSYKDESMMPGKKRQSEKIKKPNLFTKNNNKRSSSALRSLHSSMIRVGNQGVVKSESTSSLMSSCLPASKKPGSSPMARRNSNSVQRNNHSVSSSMNLPNGWNSASQVTADSLGMTRKSLIMERMGDKEIVKCAFRTFRNDFDQLKISRTRNPSSAENQIPISDPRSIISGSENQRKNNSLLSKDGGRVTFGSRSVLRAEKRKEFVRKLEKKTEAEETEKVLMLSKHKAEKAEEVKNLRRSLNFKATPMPRFYKTAAAAPRPNLTQASLTR